MQRGEVWWAELPTPIGKRPVVIISRQRAIQVRVSIIVAQVTTTIRDIPVEVPLGQTDGMPKRCVINCDVLTTIPKEALKERMCFLTQEKLLALHAALRFALGLD
ncbi:MAG: type II toxin-antitoxin system PemK/MazF family toxin [Candidatus Omnitrophica bacterium]|nr:type II toxin-antitoxin system PemK/MazF family toxin [Candidatus Omnitrophota bacterium]